MLELNTFAHAICALAIYFAWWNKPLDVEEPVQLRVGSEFELETASGMSCDPRLDPKLEWPKRGPSEQITQMIGRFDLEETRGFNEAGPEETRETFGEYWDEIQGTALRVPIFPMTGNQGSENHWKFSTETRLSTLRNLRHIIHLAFHGRATR